MNARTEIKPAAMGHAWCTNCVEMRGTYAGGRCDGCDTVLDHEAAAALDEQEIAEAFAVDNWRPRIVVDLTR